MPQIFQNILVTCMVNLGDVVLSTGCAQLLKELYPGARVTYMVKNSIGPILENHPYIDEVIMPDYQAKKKSFRQMLALISAVRQRQFDLCVSLDRKSRPALVALLAGIPTRIIGDRLFDVKPSFVTKFYTRVIHTPDDFRNTHQAAIFQAVITGFVGIEHDLVRPCIGGLRDADKKNADNLYQAIPTANKKLAVCIRGTFHLKNWPLDKFAIVLNQLRRQYDVSFVLIGVEDDYCDSEKLIALLDEPDNTANFCGKTDLKSLAGLLALVDGFLTVDTGAMHIAAAVNTPIVGIFRCISAKRWSPLCDENEVLTVQLSECPKEGPPEVCPEKNCLETLSAEAVTAAAQKILGASPVRS